MSIEIKKSPFKTKNRQNRPLPELTIPNNKVMLHDHFFPNTINRIALTPIKNG